jgi:NTE family protein
MRQTSRVILVSAVLSLGLGRRLVGQTPPAQAGELGKRPKVGLALGGGGARGFAHIGALRALEAMHIPIDYIAGTSMGSVVASMYASGYTPDAMEKIVRAIPWDTVFNDTPGRADLSFRNKEDDFYRLLPIQLGLTKKGLGLPPGLIEGNKLSYVLRTVLLPSLGAADFDHMRIPFRAVAADVQTGDVVVLSRGDLARSVRASMAIPAAFTPVLIDGKLLIDGGEAQNLPVQTVRAMGADIVIAIDVGASGEASEKPENVAEMLGSIIDIPLKQNTMASRKLADVFIQPDLKGYSTGSFGEFAVVVPRGQQAVERAAGELARLSVPAAEFEAWRARVQAPFPPPPVIDVVELAPVPGFDHGRLERLVQSKPGPFNDKVLRADLKRIYALGSFLSVGYDVVREDERWILRITAVPKNWGTTFVRPGLGFQSDAQGSTNFAFSLLVDATEMNWLGGRWKTLVNLGTDIGVRSVFYQPVEPTGTFSVAPFVGWGHNNVPIYSGKEQISQYLVTRFQGGLDLVADFGTWGELRAGYSGGTGNAKRKIGTATQPDVSASFGGIQARFVVDQADDVNVPRSGYLSRFTIDAERTGLGATSSYDKFEGAIVGVQTLGRLTGLLKVAGGDSLGTTLPYYDTFSLGGLFRLSGRPPDQLRGQAYGLTAALLYYRLNEKSGLIIKDTYVGVSIEAGNTWDPRTSASFSNLTSAGSVFVAVNTLIGPIYLAYGRASNGLSSFYFTLNRAF